MPPVPRAQLSAQTEDGVTLVLERFPAAGQGRAVCLCTHAMMAGSSYLWRGAGGGFAGHLARRGVETFVLDWRGHGRSRATGPDWCFDDYVRSDLPAAVAAVCRAAGIVPGELVYMGHSLGGVVGLAALGTSTTWRPRALGLWATSLWLPGTRGSRRRRAIMELYDLASKPLGYAPIRALGLGSENEPRGYVRQLAGWARTGQWQSRDGIDYLAGLGRIDVPVWAACGLGDRLCTVADAEVMRSRLCGAMPLRCVGRRTGDAVDADHFTLFTRPELSPVWDEFVEFAIGAGR